MDPRITQITLVICEFANQATCHGPVATFWTEFIKDVKNEAAVIRVLNGADPKNSHRNFVIIIWAERNEGDFGPDIATTVAIEKLLQGPAALSRYTLHPPQIISFQMVGSISQLSSSTLLADLHLIILPTIEIYQLGILDPTQLLSNSIKLRTNDYLSPERYPRPTYGRELDSDSLVIGWSNKDLRNANREPQIALLAILPWQITGVDEVKDCSVGHSSNKDDTLDQNRCVQSLVEPLRDRISRIASLQFYRLQLYSSSLTLNLSVPRPWPAPESVEQWNSKNPWVTLVIFDFRNPVMSSTLQKTALERIINTLQEQPRLKLRIHDTTLDSDNIYVIVGEHLRGSVGDDEDQVKKRVEMVKSVLRVARMSLSPYLRGPPQIYHLTSPFHDRVFVYGASWDIHVLSVPWGEKYPISCQILRQQNPDTPKLVHWHWYQDGDGFDLGDLAGVYESWADTEGIFQSSHPYKRARTAVLFVGWNPDRAAGERYKDPSRPCYLNRPSPFGPPGQPRRPPVLAQRNDLYHMQFLEPLVEFEKSGAALQIFRVGIGTVWDKYSTDGIKRNTRRFSCHIL